MPSGFEAQTGVTDGAAAPDLADATDAVAAVDAGDASTLPAAVGVVPSRGSATDAVRCVAETAVPVRRGSARVGSIQNDSPKGVAQERCDLKRPTAAVRFSPHFESPTHQRGDRYRRRSSTRSDAESFGTETVRPVFPGLPPRRGRAHCPAVRLLLRGGKSSFVG